MPNTGRPQGATVTLRRRDTGLEETSSWNQAPVELVASAAPWRTFRWCRGQCHFSGSYWSFTERDHIVYESRLELSRLLFADFDPSVHRIAAQPFLLRARVDGRERKHIPDYFLLTTEGPGGRRQAACPFV